MFKSVFGQMTEEKYLEYLDKTYAKFTVQNIRFDKLPKSFLLLDTREQEEYNVSHIKNAIQISYDNFEEERLSDFSKNDTVVLYCSVGYRSSVIAEKLMDLGYRKVFNLYGGIFYWANKGQILVDSENKETKKLHGYNKFWSRYIYNKDIEKVY